MKGRPQKLDTPNCMVFQEIEKAPDLIRDVPEEEAESQAKMLARNTEAISL